MTVTIAVLPTTLFKNMIFVHFGRKLNTIYIFPPKRGHQLKKKESYRCKHKLNTLFYIFSSKKRKSTENRKSSLKHSWTRVLGCCFKLGHIQPHRKMTCKLDQGLTHTTTTQPSHFLVPGRFFRR